MRLQAGESFHEQWERRQHEKRRASFLHKSFREKDCTAAAVLLLLSLTTCKIPQKWKRLSLPPLREDERIGTVVLAESSGLKLSKAEITFPEAVRAIRQPHAS